MAVCPPDHLRGCAFAEIPALREYVIYSLPGVVVCAATGVLSRTSCAQRPPSGRIIVCAIVSGALLGYMIYTKPFRQWIIQSPLQQIRESVVYCRGTLDPSPRRRRECTHRQLLHSSLSLRRSYGATRLSRRLYCGNATSRQRWRALLLNVGMPWAARQYSPQMWSLFTNRRPFRGARPTARIRASTGSSQNINAAAPKISTSAATTMRSVTISCVIFASFQSDV